MFRTDSAKVVIRRDELMPLLHLVGDRIHRIQMEEEEYLEKQYQDSLESYNNMGWIMRKLFFKMPTKKEFMRWHFSDVPRLKQIQALLGSSGWAEIHLTECDWRLLKGL